MGWEIGYIEAEESERKREAIWAGKGLIASSLEIKSHDVVNLQSHGGKSRPAPESRHGEHTDQRSWHKDMAGLVGKWEENCCSIQKQSLILAIMPLAGPFRPKVPLA